MYREIPPIPESVAELKQRLQHEHHGRRKPRLQMLYLLASGQASTTCPVSSSTATWLLSVWRFFLPL